jgi:hypothetical protein
MNGHEKTRLPLGGTGFINPVYFLLLKVAV